MKKFIFSLLFLSTSFINAEDTRDITKKLVYAQPEDIVQNAMNVPAEHPSSIGHSPTTGQEALENSKPFSRVSNYSDSSRFEQIKVAPEIAANEIDF